MEAMVARNLFTGYRIGELDAISVSHLQFADDTLLMGVKSWANVRALRAVSGLKASWFLGTGVGSFKDWIVWVEESLPFFWWSSDSAKVCLD
ncbi:RNA-directed DNA polymerase (Reverse transcriptase), partial [Trifolium medium]|nr:RNA-directed DNA polymerase (Reverse transcriptase) [Trifolium medium]